MTNTFTVTLTNANTNYSLLTLVRAIDPNFIDAGDFVVQTGDGTGAQVYLFGDSTISASIGTAMLSGDYSAHFDSIKGLFVRCDTAGKTATVQRVGAHRI